MVINGLILVLAIYGAADLIIKGLRWLEAWSAYDTDRRIARRQRP